MTIYVHLSDLKGMIFRVANDYLDIQTAVWIISLSN